MMGNENDVNVGNYSYCAFIVRVMDDWCYGIDGRDGTDPMGWAIEWTAWGKVRWFIGMPPKQWSISFHFTENESKSLRVTQETYYNIFQNTARFNMRSFGHDLNTCNTCCCFKVAACCLRVLTLASCSWVRFKVVKFDDFNRITSRADVPWTKCRFQ